MNHKFEEFQKHAWVDDELGWNCPSECLLQLNGYCPAVRDVDPREFESDIDYFAAVGWRFEEHHTNPSRKRFFGRENGGPTVLLCSDAHTELHKDDVSASRVGN